MIKKILSATEYGVTKAFVDSDAWVVISKLQANGFDAFIVGGAVRDLLLGIQPKDFDIVTNATPEEVHKAFKRSSVIVGRRFKIVHVMFEHFDPERLVNNRPAFSRHVIEVSTYRSQKIADEHVNVHGKIMLDNDYGTQEEDSTRRDFTVNALYYDPTTEIIIDYHDGITDIANKNLRMIGDPVVRYTEDPVRILRVIRLASKLGMAIDPTTSAPIAKVKQLLVNEHKWRLHEEMLKILLSGHALQCISYLQRIKLPKSIFVIFDKLFLTSKPDEMSLRVLAMTDARIQDGNYVSMSFILAGILWNRVNHKWQALKKRSKTDRPRRQYLVDAIESLREFALFAGISRNIYTKISDVWLMQFDFDHPIPPKVVRVLKNKRFRQGLHLFTLRGEFGQSNELLCEWWLKVSEAVDDVGQRDDLLKELELTKRLQSKSDPSNNVHHLAENVIKGSKMLVGHLAKERYMDLTMSNEIVDKGINQVLSRKVLKVKESPTLVVTSLANQMKKSGKDVLILAAGEPDFNTPLYVKKAAIAAIMEDKTRYTPINGIVELRQAIIDKFKRENNLNYELDQVIVSTGAKQSIYNALQVLVDDGDEVIIPVPAWVSYPDMVKLAGGNPVLVKCGIDQEFKLNAEVLEQGITVNTKLLILNSPSNPTGMIYSEAELLEIAEVLRKYPRIHVISDDIYEHIVFSGYKVVNLANVAPDLIKRIVVINGVSKAYAMTGWRIGYAACGNTQIIKEMNKVQSQSTSCATSIAQYAAVSALNGGLELVVQMQRSFESRHQYVVERINKINGLACIPAHGAFYVFFDCRDAISNLYKQGRIEQADDITLAKYLLENSLVAFVPGSAFGLDGFMRLSFATSLDQISIALDRVEALLC